MTGVVNVDPVPNELPPVETLYQFTSGEANVLRLTEPLPQIVPPVSEGEDGVELTIACTGMRALLQYVPAST